MPLLPLQHEMPLSIHQWQADQIRQRMEPEFRHLRKGLLRVLPPINQQTSQHHRHAPFQVVSGMNINSPASLQDCTDLPDQHRHLRSGRCGTKRKRQMDAFNDYANFLADLLQFFQVGPTSVKFCGQGQVNHALNAAFQQVGQHSKPGWAIIKRVRSRPQLTGQKFGKTGDL